MVLFVKSERSSKHLGHGDVVWVWQLFVVEGLLFPLSRYAGGGQAQRGWGFGADIAAHIDGISR